MIENKKYPIDRRNGRVDCPNIEQRIGESLSSYAYKAGVDFKIELYESDIRWIENNIVNNSQNRNRDIFWRLDGSYKYQGHLSPYILDYMITFFEGFIDTPGTPPNVNRILIVMVGNMRAWLPKFCLAPYQHFFVEAWLRKTEKGR